MDLIWRSPSMDQPDKQSERAAERMGTIEIKRETESELDTARAWKTETDRFSWQKIEGSKSKKEVETVSKRNWTADFSVFFSSNFK